MKNDEKVLLREMRSKNTPIPSPITNTHKTVKKKTMAITSKGFEAHHSACLNKQKKVNKQGPYFFKKRGTPGAGELYAIILMPKNSMPAISSEVTRDNYTSQGSLLPTTQKFNG